MQCKETSSLRHYVCSGTVAHTHPDTSVSLGVQCIFELPDACLMGKYKKSIIKTVTQHAVDVFDGLSSRTSSEVSKQGLGEGLRLMIT